MVAWLKSLIGITNKHTMEYATLNNGIRLPMVGLGTNSLPNENIESIIASAYELGYRKFDTAWLYGNEEALGNAFKSLSLPRESIFITSKLHANDLRCKGRLGQWGFRKKSVRKAFLQTCKRLKTDYIDLYLIHWPFSEFLYMWEEVEKLYSQGLIRSIGVSSFLESHLEELKKHSDIIPAVNQFEINPFNSQKKLISFCQERGILPEAYASFGTTRKQESASEVMLGQEIVRRIAEEHGKTPTQIILRWEVQQGISVIPRSKNRVHQEENISIFDFKLSAEEMSLMDSLNRDMYSRGDPHKTL